MSEQKNDTPPKADALATQPTEVTPPAKIVVDNRPPEVHKFELQQRAARLFAMSGLFADIKGQSMEQAIAQAFVKISLGDSMGFNPAESMTGIDLIQGRVAVGASLRAARMQRAGYSWDILQLDDKGCRLQLKFKGQQLLADQTDETTGDTKKVPAIVSFMATDAARAGLSSKDNYKKYPPDMLFARAITRAQRWYAPGVLGVDILSTEEAMDGGLFKTPENSDTARAATNNKIEELKSRYIAPVEEQSQATEHDPAEENQDAETPVENYDADPTSPAAGETAQPPEEKGNRRGRNSSAVPTGKELFGK